MRILDVLPGKLKLSKTLIDVQWAFISLAISSFVHFLLRIVLGRDLGPAGLGIYTLVFAIYVLGTQYSNFGIGVALTKYVAEHKDDTGKVREFVSSGMTGSLIFGTVISIILFVFSGQIAVFVFHSPELDVLLKFLALCFPFIALQKSVLGVLNGQRWMNAFAYLNLCQNTLILLVSIFLVLGLKLGINGAVLGLAGPTIFTSIISIFFVRKFWKVPSRIFDHVLKELTSFGFYVTLANSIATINAQVGILLIGFYLNEKEIGFYAVSTLIVQGLQLLPGAVQSITGPIVSQLHGKKDYEGIKQVTRDAFIKTLAITAAMSAGLVLFGGYLINIVFSSEYAAAYIPMVILIFGNLVYAPFISIGSTLTNMGRVNIIFKIDLACMIANVLLTIILVPTFGINGAAFSMAVSLIATTILNLYVIRRYLYLDSFDSDKSRVASG